MRVRSPTRFFRIPLISAALAVLASTACAPTGPVRSGAGEAGAPSVAAAARTPGAADFGDWTADAPGVRHHIRATDVPVGIPNADPEQSTGTSAKVVPPPQGMLPQVPAGFTVQLVAAGLDQPRNITVAPNGDVFLAESGAGRVLVFRASPGGAPAKVEVFAGNLDRPYGIAFLPPSDPQYVYVAASNEVVRYPYRSGDLRASGPAETIVANIPTKRHWTRDLAVSGDGKRLFVAIGSASNLGVDGMPDMALDDIRRLEATHGRGAAWGEEENRAVVRVFDPDGRGLRNYATGLRNCSGMAMQPGTDHLWCVVNERDHLGANVTPDFMARIDDGQFYGWPWYHLGDREDPAMKGKRPDLRGLVKAPDVLFQAHSSALSVAFYDREAFPAEYRGDAFVALHGSHTRPVRTGYKVVRVLMRDGHPTGEYEDFMTGFVLDNDTVWGRPAGVAVTRDGALLVTDDGNGRVYRVSRN